MSFVKVMVHAVWGTKSHHPFLTKEIKSIILAHINENAHEKQIFIDTINGAADHLHCLYGLNADMTIAKSLQLIKGESSFWINNQQLTKVKFEWADEYYAVSVSESHVDLVRKYISNQEITIKNLPLLMNIITSSRNMALKIMGKAKVVYSIHNPSLKAGVIITIYSNSI